MIAYILKTIFCAALFLAFYLVLLEREKMHRFNRFYLLFTLLLSFCIPLIPMQVSEEYLPADTTMPFLLPEQETQVVSQQPVTNTEAPSVNPLLLVYVAVTLFLLCRFLKNLFSIYRAARSNNATIYAGVNLVLLDKPVSPHSFLNYVFINRLEYESGSIEKEILLHELAHVKQKHSVDILLLEGLSVFAWVNPLVFLFNKAVQLNHEYLADDAVIQNLSDKSDYQLLLIEKARQPDGLSLSSHFNYLITKKRLVMMMKSTNAGIALIKQTAILPLLAAILFLFSSKTVAVAQENTEKKAVQTTDSVAKRNVMEQPAINRKLERRIMMMKWRSPGSTEEGVSDVLMKEYESIENKYITTNDPFWWKKVTVSEEDLKRLEEIYLQMNYAQQAMQRIGFIGPTPPLPKIKPTEKQFESWKNPKQYGVWVDNKKVDNKVLAKYNYTDFSHAHVSKLYGPAKVNKIYNYQLNILTNAAFEDYNRKARENKKNQMVVRGALKDPVSKSEGTESTR